MTLIVYIETAMWTSRINGVWNYCTQDIQHVYTASCSQLLWIKVLTINSQTLPFNYATT